MRRTWKRFLPLLLVIAMVLSGSVTAYAEPATESSDPGVTFEQVDNDAVADPLKPVSPAALEAAPPHADDELVRVSIVLSDKATIDKGYSTKDIADNSKAMKYRADLKAKQDALASKISKEVLGGARLDVVWNLTLAANMISANVEYGKIKGIKKMVGVKDVIVENRYDHPIDEVTEPNMAIANTMVGGDLAWASGVTGAGSRVAIVDTGLDTDHELFDADAFQYAIDEVDARRAEDGMDPIALMTEADVTANWDKLNIAERIGGSDGVYVSAKVPFGANYVDSDLDITHDNDSQGEHGSHVAGIATANRYVKDDDGSYAESLDKVATQGEAPDAQLVIMKVFGKGGGAYDSDYMVAIEDAIILGCDSVNLSLGSSNAGLATNSTYADILNSLAESDTVVTISAGNSYDWSENSLGAIYEDDVNYDTVGSPGSYANAFTVASIDNVGMTGAPLTFNGDQIEFYTETESSGARMNTIPGDYDYVYVDSIGIDSEEKFNEFAALSEVTDLEGKVLLCNRGGSSFYQKGNAAIDFDPAAVIIVNNQPGTISMLLDGYTGTFPMVSITQDAGNTLKQRPASGTATLSDGREVTYYTGTVNITDKLSASVVSDTLTMSDFSSWGVPGDLSLKPEITAPGGNIYSVNGMEPGGKGYELMSGTSMAAPQMAGLTAVVGQYIRDNDLLEKTGMTKRQLAQSLLMSTAVPVKDGNGNWYSVLKQGAGLANVNNAINARSFITVTEVPDTAPKSAAASIADGKVKAELGEIDKTFRVAFNVTNFSDEDMEFYLGGDFFTQAVEDGWRLEDTTSVNAAVSWMLDGEEYAPGDAKYDFNGDSVANGKDAQHLLDYCADNSIKLYNQENADMDGDGDIDTYDAYLAFEGLNGVNAVLKAGDTAAFTAEVTLPELPGENGNYAEGYLIVTEGDTDDGALGVTHTIPVLGFQGSWSDASMFDRGSALEYSYGFGDGAEDSFRYPYMAVDSALGDSAYNVEGFVVTAAGEGRGRMFGGNPFDIDETYHPERNALNAKDTISAVQYSQIRNAAGSRFYVSDRNGRKIRNSESINISPSYAAFFYASQGMWRYTSTAYSLNWSAGSTKEGTKLNLNYQLAPEYYVDDNGGIDWNTLGKGAALTIPFVVDNTAPYIVDVETSGENNGTLDVIAHDNEYIAAVALYTEDGTLIKSYGGIEGIRRGEQHTYDFDLSGNTENHLLVQVYDYAGNLSTWKINFNKEELENDPLTLTLSSEKLRIYRGNTAKLTASVSPWGMSDEVTWASDNEDIATVDEDGIVTGVAAGTTTIIATSVLDDTVTASCEVEVFTLDMTVAGGVQDADGNPMMYLWDLNGDEGWQPAGDLEKGLTAMSLDWQKDEGGYFYQQDSAGYINKVDLNTLQIEATSAGSSAFGAPMEDFDFPFYYNMSSDTHKIFAVAEGYFLESEDVMDNTFNMGYSLGIYLMIYSGANNFVALAWGGANAQNGVDYFYALDDAGMIWELTVSNGDLDSLGYIATDLQLTYPAMDDTRGNSLVMGDDGEFYLAHFNGKTSELYQLAYDTESGSFVSTKLGNFGDDVWPATVIGVVENGSGGDGQGSTADPAQRRAKAPESAFTKVDASFVKSPAAADAGTGAAEANASGADGALNRILTADAEPDKVTTDVTINITADVLTTNGLVTVEYDPDTVEMLEHNVFTDYKSEIVEPGRYVLAHVTMDGIPKDQDIARLVFSKESKGTVTIRTSEVNNSHDIMTEIVTLGATIGEHTHHEWSEPVWTWTGDDENGYTAASAAFTCAIGGEIETVEATIDVTKNENYDTVYTATVSFEGTEYTDTRVVENKGARIIVDDKTAGAASASLEADKLYKGEVSFSVTADKACLLAVDNGDGTYTALPCTTTEEGEHMFTVTVADADLTVVMAFRGDINMDGVISSKDVTMLSQASVGNRTLSPLQILIGDFNGDGVINAKDVTKLSQVSVGNSVYDW